MGNSQLEIDFDNLTIEQMNELEADLKKHRESRRKQHLVAARQEYQKIADAYGFTVEEIATQRVAKSRISGIVAVKYRDPQIGSLTWTGRGKKPKWVQAYQDNGGALEDLVVRE